MNGLREQLQHCFRGRTCLMGLGSVDYGDDGLGVRLAQRLHASGVPDVVVAETVPERHLGCVAEKAFDDLVFLDAVEFGGEPGSVLLMNGAQIAARFPQVSTHKLSLSVLVKWVEAGGTTRTWLLGVQPESIKPSRQLTPTVQATLDLLERWLRSMKSRSQPEQPEAMRPGAEVNV